MTHEERMEALEAGRILQSEVFRDAFTCLDARYVKAWRTSTDAVKREDWWYMQRALAAVKKELFDYVPAEIKDDFLKMLEDGNV